MALSHFVINVTFDDAFKDGEPEIVAETESLWQYRQANTKYYLASAYRLDKDEMEGVVVHELTHVLLSPMESVTKKDKDEQCELAVENVTRAFMSIKNEVRRA